MSLTLMKCLLVAYFVLSMVSLAEGRLGQMVYWVGACVITLGVLLMRGGH